MLGCLSPWKGQHIIPFRFTAKPYSSAACRVEMALFTSEKTEVLPSVPMGGVQAKGRSPVRGVGEVGFIHTSIRQSVVHFLHFVKYNICLGLVQGKIQIIYGKMRTIID